MIGGFVYGVGDGGIGVGVEGGGVLILFVFILCSSLSIWISIGEVKMKVPASNAFARRKYVPAGMSRASN